MCMHLLLLWLHPYNWDTLITSQPHCIAYTMPEKKWVEGELENTNSTVGLSWPTDNVDYSNLNDNWVGKREGVSLSNYPWQSPSQTHSCQIIKVFLLISIVAREWYCHFPWSSRAPMPLREMLTNIKVTKSSFPHSAERCKVQPHPLNACQADVRCRGH